MKGMKVAVLAIGLASSVGTQASLLGRDLDGSAATYEAYYDDQLNITWLADANYAKTQYDQSGGVAGDADGYMRWSTAHAWAASLGYYGITGWRLPVMAPPAFFQGYRASNNGTEVGGYGATRTGWGLPTDADGIWSEMGWMYYFNLGNLGYCTPDDANPYGCVEQAGYNVKNRGPFLNMQNEYWTDTDAGANHAWFFGIGDGAQYPSHTDSIYAAWAVRDGDVARVPEPATLALLSLGLTGMIGLGRRRLD